MQALSKLNFGKEQNMKAELEYRAATIVRDLGRKGCLAPSLRVPVTADNREFLRWLRAAELSAWERADRGSRSRLAGAMV